MAEDWVFLTEVDNDVEADIVCGFLIDKGIAAKKEDSSPYAGAMRIIGGQAYEVQVFVPQPLLEKAKAALQELETK